MNQVGAGVPASFGKLLRGWLRTLDPEALAFDLVGAAVVVVFRQAVAGNGDFWSALSWPAALALVIFSVIVLAWRLKSFMVQAGRSESQWLRLVLAGALVFITALQPLFISAAFFKLGFFQPLVAPTMLLLSLAIVFIFCAVLGFDERKGFDETYMPLGIASAFILGASNFPLRFDEGSAVMGGLLAVLVLVWFLLRRSGRNIVGLNEFPDPPPPRSLYRRLATSALAAVCLWAWWDLSAGLVLTTTTDFWGRLWMLYISGPLLYRIVLISRPPVNPVGALIGLTVLLLAII